MKHPWSEQERRRWEPPKQQSISAWAEESRIIVSKDAAEPGPWRNSRTPYLVGIMDALSDYTIEEVYVVKPARCGGSEVGRNFLGRNICQDPGAFLIVFPSESKAKEQLRNEIFPLLETPALLPFQTGCLQDLKSEWIELQNMRIYPAWSGSPTTLAERTIRYVWLSEVDKYPPFSGREADPMSLAKRRTQTWGVRKKIYAESTPTTREGAIWLAAEACPDKRRYWVPCPRCGELQILVWSQVRWPKYEKENITRREMAERIKAEESAHYECPACKGKILDTEKGPMLEAGCWRSEGKPGSVVAFYISGLLSMLGFTWSRMVAQYLNAKESYGEGDRGPLMEFFTQSLGEPFEEQIAALKFETFEKKRQRGHKPRVIPSWGAVLLTSVDTQKEHFYWVTRAWGVHVIPGGLKRVPRSRLVDRGLASSFEELRLLTLDASYPIEGQEGEVLQPRVMAIDARGGTAAASEGTDSSRTDEVFRFSKTDPSRIIPIMGHGGDRRQAVPIRTSRYEYKPPNHPGKGYFVTLHTLDSHHYADCLAHLVEQEPVVGEDGTVVVPEMWEVNEDIDNEYASHMSGEVKVPIRKGGQVVEVWQKRSSGRRIDWLDCERYNLALADIMRVAGLPEESALLRDRAEAAKRRSLPAPPVATRNPLPQQQGSPGSKFTLGDRPFLVCNRKPQ